MSEVLENIQQIVETPISTIEVPDMLDLNNWKSTPTIPIATIKDPIIEEKDKQIEKEKPTSDKPNEPEKIPTATPEPIQDRPENTDPKTNKEEPLKFANDESEKVFNLLKEGKLDEVFTVISEQKKLASADKLPPADVIKLNLQYQNKDFTPQEIQELFEDTYVMPEKPIQSITEEDDDFKAREDKYKSQVERLEKRIARDAKPAASELLKLSKEIVLPDIQRQVPVNNEPTQEELDALKTQAQEFLKSVDDATNALNGYQVTFKDEEVSIPVAYKLTKEEKAAIQPLIALSNTNAGEFLTKIGWIDDKGQINAAKLAEDLPFILNKESVLQKMVTETGNKRHEASIKAIKNIDYSGRKSTGGDTGITPEQARQGFENAFFI